MVVELNGKYIAQTQVILNEINSTNDSEWQSRLIDELESLKENHRESKKAILKCKVQRIDPRKYKELITN